jgi:hypothetical protein
MIILLGATVFIAHSNIVAACLLVFETWPPLKIAAYVGLITVGAWAFSVFLETSTREEVTDLYVTKLIQSAHFAEPEFEGVHFGGAIEKYVWSLTDLTKEALTIASAIAIATLTHPIAAVLSVVLAALCWRIAPLFIVRANLTRLEMISRQKRLTRKLNAEGQNSCETVSPHDPVLLCIMQLGIARRKVQRIRFSLSLTAGLIALMWTGIAALIASVNLTLGIVATILGLRLTQEVTHLIDSLVVFVGEKPHMERLK